MSHNIPQGVQGDVGSTSRASKDQNCYFPCKRWKGLKIRRLQITTTKRHCRDYGHTKGMREYHPLVSYSLYVLILHIVFVNVEENDNTREEEKPINLTMFAWILFLPCSLVLLSSSISLQCWFSFDVW
jgi:hypothetical protein